MADNNDLEQKTTLSANIKGCNIRTNERRRNNNR